MTAVKQNNGLGSATWYKELWAIWAISVAISLLRLGLRTWHVGIRRWAWDDYFVVAAVLSYTGHQVCSVRQAHLGTNSIHLTLAEVALLTPERKHSISMGSLYHHVSFYLWAMALWALKGCMLSLYSRLSMGIWQNRLVKFTAWLTFATFLGMWPVNTLKCGLPVSTNWRVDPPPPHDCPSGLLMYYYIGPTNFITDLLILSIPLPLIAELRNLPMKKRILLFALFCSGFIAVAICAVRTIMCTLSVHGIGPATVRNQGSRATWTAREIAVCLTIVNVLPLFGCLQAAYREVTNASNTGTGGSSFSSKKYKLAGLETTATVDVVDMSACAGREDVEKWAAAVHQDNKKAMEVMEGQVGLLPDAPRPARARLQSDAKYGYADDLLK